MFFKKTTKVEAPSNDGQLPPIGRSRNWFSSLPAVETKLVEDVVTHAFNLPLECWKRSNASSGHGSHSLLTIYTAERIGKTDISVINSGDIYSGHSYRLLVGEEEIGNYSINGIDSSNDGCSQGYSGIKHLSDHIFGYYMAKEAPDREAAAREYERIRRTEEEANRKRADDSRRSI